jgi:hypothetical protein
MSDEFFHLIANPFKKNKNNHNHSNENLDEEIYYLLKKKYKLYTFNDDIYKIIIEDIDKKIINYTIDTTVNKFINELFESLEST